MSGYDWVFWLNATNIALGIVVVAGLAVGGGLAWEWMIRHKHRRGSCDLDEEMHAMLRKRFGHIVPRTGVGRPQHSSSACETRHPNFGEVSRRYP